MSNFQEFFELNAVAQREVRAFEFAAAVKHSRARTDDSRRKWGRALDLANRAQARIALASSFATEVRDAFESVRSFHGTFDAAADANPHLREKLRGALRILDDVRASLLKFPAFYREAVAA